MRPDPDSGLLLELSLGQKGPSVLRKQRSRNGALLAPPLKLALQLGPPTAAAQGNQLLDASKPGSASEPGIDEPEAPLPFAAVTPGPPPNAAAQQGIADRLSDFSLVEGWAIPPIRWGGNLASSYNWNANSDGNSSLSSTDLLNLRASSYIYQPWYAQVSGGLGLAMGDTINENNDARTRSRNNSVTYDGNLSLFPQSRFPLQAYVQQSNSRIQANASSAEYSSTRFGARQSYRPLAGQQSYSGSYDHSVVETSNVRSVVDTMQGTYSDHFGDHGVGASAHFSTTTGDLGGQKSNLFNLNGSHNWRSSDQLTVSSQASLMDNQIRTFSGEGLISNDTQLVQLNSSFSWLPDKEVPLSVMGGGNFLSMTTDTNSGGTELTNLGGYANANYRISDQLQANAGLSAAQSKNNNVDQFSSSQNASLSYSGMPLTFGNYSYNWGAGAGVNNQIASRGAGNQGFTGQAQHSLLRSVIFDEASTLTLNASEAVSVTSNSQSGQSTALIHSGGAMWRRLVGERTAGSLSATATDTVSSGNFSSHYFNLLVQGNLQTQLTGRSALAASLNFNYSEQIKSPQSSSGPFSSQRNLDGSSSLNGSGVVTYSHRNPFEVIGLYYSASFQVNMSQTNQRVVSGDPNATLWQTGTVLQQNLDYRIGRVGFRATTSLADLNGKENASIFFMVNRDFGGY